MINQIAAGEVIESADSVVKELVENAIDAGATSIKVSTREGGLKSILVSDNGSGIEKEDLELVVAKHATSKVQSISDLSQIRTYGFRGEAVASISSISKLKLESGVQNHKLGWSLKVNGGRIEYQEPIAHFKGTRFIIEDLFFKTPVRKKFIKSYRSEDAKIRNKVVHFALVREDIRFTLIQNSREIYKLKPQSKKERIIDLFGKNFKHSLLEVDFVIEEIHIWGYISNPDLYKSDRKGQFMFVNQRPVEWRYFSFLLKKCYDELLPTKAHPFSFLFFTLPSDFIDVNVHPTKKEIRFLNENQLISIFIKSIEKTLKINSSVSMTIPELKGHSNKRTPQKMESIKALYSAKTTQTNLGEALFAKPQKSSYSVKESGPGVHLEKLGENLIQNKTFVFKRHFGLLFETFILAEGEDSFYIIDQHTAHERIRYEEIMNEMKKKELKIQPLLTPIRVDFSLQDAETILEKLEEYKKIGFLLEYINDGSFVIREVPVFIEIKKVKEIVIDFLNQIKNQNLPDEKIYDILAKCVSCKSAIKKGDQLSSHLISEILNRLGYCKEPFRCPHGRPTLIKLDRLYLDKLFKRK